ncbi:PREDICTED: BAG [Prunus dulcis]|uniref:PREDICTED: BAG n=1 Tax=Prunus dulcis TaxID=3755 RepID=A0A5E4EW70_PRUDU|nr:BAG family molecular chaperone regulator 6-like [Prunus dulcis]VVA19964.1 PREDICTED: BAG [Prunus dulcis]
MDNSYFKRHWNSFAPHHGYSPSFRQVPVQRQATPSPKVVSIPVQFVGLERNRSASAQKIQKAFRGFQVRKSVKKIAAIKGDVDEIEKRISKKETVELMKREAKERLKVNETLMSLLFRLDSVKGVDPGVRDFRRAVIKKAIALQERVDAAVADDDHTLGEVGEASGIDNGESISETVGGAVEDKDSGEDFEGGKTAPVDQTQDLQSAAREEDCNSNAAPKSLNGTLNLPSLEQTAETDGVTNVNEIREIVGDESEEEGESESQSVSSYNPQNSMIEDAEENPLVKQEEEEEDGMEIVKAEDEGGNGIGFGVRDREENKRSRELLERMVEDNEKMMGMMVELFERNEIQTRMLSSLSQRVEQLERALVCERLRRRKKRQAAAAAADFVPQDNNARKQ